MLVIVDCNALLHVLSYQLLTTTMLCCAMLCWLQISGGDWKEELLFTVPRDHPEVERLEGRYKK